MRQHDYEELANSLLFVRTGWIKGWFKLGVLYMKVDKVVQPDVDRLQDYQTHAGQQRGQWPSNAEITAAIFERAAQEKAYQQELDRPCGSRH